MPLNYYNILEIAAKAHEGQFRNDRKTPYITHPVAVANLFPEWEVGARAVALLHDTLEDTSLTAQALLGQGVSPIVVEAVVAMTKRENEAYDDYLIRVKANWLARKVKIADILSNLSDSPSKNQVKKYAKALKFLLDPL